MSVLGGLAKCDPSENDSVADIQVSERPHKQNPRSGGVYPSFVIADFNCHAMSAFDPLRTFRVMPDLAFI